MFARALPGPWPRRRFERVLRGQLRARGWPIPPSATPRRLLDGENLGVPLITLSGDVAGRAVIGDVPETPKTFLVVASRGTFGRKTKGASPAVVPDRFTTSHHAGHVGEGLSCAAKTTFPIGPGDRAPWSYMWSIWRERSEISWKIWVLRFIRLRYRAHVRG